MKKTINFTDFEWEFKQIRPYEFSSAGLKALFEYLEDFEENVEEEIELDVIKLCCNYTEYKNWESVELDYNMSKVEIENNTFVIDFNYGVIIENF